MPQAGCLLPKRWGLLESLCWGTSWGLLPRAFTKPLLWVLFEALPRGFITSLAWFFVKPPYLGASWSPSLGILWNEHISTEKNMFANLHPWIGMQGWVNIQKKNKCVLLGIEWGGGWGQCPKTNVLLEIQWNIKICTEKSHLPTPP